MVDLYIVQLLLLPLIFVLLTYCFYSSEKIRASLHKVESKISFPNYFPTSKKLKSLGMFAFISISIIIMSLSAGLIDTSLEFISMLNLNAENKAFKEVLQEVGMGDYTFPQDLEVEKGKNVIVISLESLERGYLSNKMAHLTPTLRALKNEWTYYDMKQNMGSGWTSGSLYTSLTGFPAFFGKDGNAIFQTAYHSNITAISHVFKQAGYEMTYLTSDARFSGMQEILHTMQIKNIIDKTLLKQNSKDKDLFERAKEEVQTYTKKEEPFLLYISTLDTHFPNGKYDKRMEEFIALQKTDLEFMVAAVDYMVGDFIDFLKSKDLLENTVIYIIPDHLKMGSPDIFDDTGERSLYVLSNAVDSMFEISEEETLYQLDLPKIILDGAGIKHNAHFLAEYIIGDKNEFIEANINSLIALNTSGLLRGDSEIKPLLRKSENYNQYKNDPSRFIAHAGGMINEFRYSNSLEALNNSYENGFRLFELDIIKTKDGAYVAAHDWHHWSHSTGYKGSLPVTKEVFLKHKVFEKYTPLTMDEINDWFRQHEDAILITDKVNEPKAFAKEFTDRSRLMMELFTLDAVKEGIKENIKSAMPSQTVLNKILINKVSKLKKIGVTDVAISRRFIAENKDLLLELKENGIKAYAYHVNFDSGIDEVYMAKYEMDYIYGIYADEWEFEN